MLSTTLLKRASKRAPTPDQKLNIAIRRYTSLALFPMLAAATASFVTTYNGVALITNWLAESSGSTELVALLVSFVAAGVSFALWMMTINLLRLYVSGRGRALGSSVLIYLLTITALSSTFTSFIGMTQESARALYLIDMAGDYATYARSLRMRAVELENAAAFIIPEAEDACVKAETEVRTGQISGSPGRGPVASRLQTLCTRKTAMAEALQATLAELNPIVADIRAQARALDALVLDTSLSLSEREIGFINQARILEGLLEDLRATDRMRAINAGYEAIGGAVSELQGLMANVSQVQANALLEIIAAEQSSSATMARMIADIESTALPEAVRAELIPATRITLRYAGDHIPQLALAFSLDAFGPLSALLFFAGSLRARRKS